MKNKLSLLIIGISIGILLGLSESPVLIQILVPILAVIAGLLSVLSGQSNQIKSEDSNNTSILGTKSINPLPPMFLITGLVLGTFLGLLAKNFDITSQGQLFGKKTNSKKEFILDSLNHKIRILELQTKITLLEKEYEFLSTTKISDSTIEDFIKMSRTVEMRDPISEKTIAGPNTFIRGYEAASPSVKVQDPCNDFKLCEKEGKDLIKALTKVSHEQFEKILDRYKYSLDSLKFKIQEKCNCN